MLKEWYEIKGGHRLEGTVTISGAKNAAVAIIPAAVLAGETCVLENLGAAAADFRVLAQRRSGARSPGCRGAGR